MIWMSLKYTVMALGKAYEKPMEMKDANTTAHPQPPSGGGTAGVLVAGGGIAGPTSTLTSHCNDRQEAEIKG